MTDEPLRGTTTAQTASPQRSSGTPITATWPTAGWELRTSSTSRDETFSPPVTTMSLARSTM